jgi:trimeric autotransporter adhesin
MTGKWLREMRWVPGRNRKPLSPLRARPCVEALEERWVPATFTVENLNDSGTGSLRQAILDANSSSGADDIVFQTGLTGTISLTSGEMTITENVTITGNGAVNSVIDAQQASRIFAIADTGSDVTLTGLTLSNGKSDVSPTNFGGAVSSLSIGRLTVNQCVLSGNSATGVGGAIYVLQGALAVNQSNLNNNSAFTAGGAIYVETGGVLDVTDSILSGNSAIGAGGAISANDLAVVRSTLSNNSAAAGGAIFAGSGTTTISQSTFFDNSATTSGGAIFAGSGTTTISQSTFFNNDARDGGAIYGANGGVTVLQSTVFTNRASSGGGGIFSDSAPLTIRNSIIAGNFSAVPDVRPSPDAGDAFVVEFSLIEKNTGTGLTATGSTTPDANGNLIGDSNGISPFLGPLQDNGGPTMTMALLPGSPALNRGNNTIAAGLTTDQRGEPFLRVFDGTVDLGAYEAQSLTLVVDTNVDEDDGDYSAGDLSLREAIRLTSASPGADTITFASSTNGTDFDLTLGLMSITDTLTITGNGATETVLDAQQVSKIFEVTHPQGMPVDLTVRTLSLVNGMSATGPSAIAGLTFGSITVSDSVLSGNVGGAINNRGPVNVTRSTLSANSGNAIVASGAITVTESTLSGNTGGTLGGAVSGSAEIIVTQSTLTGNSAFQGGAIHGTSGPITVIQSTITGNTATGLFGVFPAVGGGIYSQSAPVMIRNSIVAGNADNGTAPDVQPSPDSGDAFVVVFSLIGKNTGTGLTATGATTPDVNGNLIGDAAGIDPMLTALADNGGPTQTMALVAGSSAFNRGSNTIAAGFTFDQRGASFARVLDGTVDMGAFESPPLAELQVTKTGAATVISGQDLTYTITVTNAGPSDAQRVSVNDTLPAGATFVSLSQDSGPSFNLITPAVGSGGTVSLAVSSLASGASATFTLVVNVGSSVTGTLTNTATGTTTTTDTNPGNDSATATTSVVQTLNGVLTVSQGPGGTGVVRIFNGDGSLRTEFSAFPGFQGGVRIGTDDVNGDGIPDIIAGAGPGSVGGHVKVFDGNTGVEIRSFFAFEGFTGGVFVAGGDLNNDGFAEIIVGAGAGAPGGHVKVFDGQTNTLLASFFAFDSGFFGGVTVAAADFNLDGVADVVVGAGPGAGPHVKVMDGTRLNQVQASGQIADSALMASFFAYRLDFAGGVYVSAGGDFNNDGVPDLMTGAGPGAGPHVRVIDGSRMTQTNPDGQISDPATLDSFFAFDPAFRGGVRVGAADIDLDGEEEIMVGAGPGADPHVRLFKRSGLTEVLGFDAFGLGFPGGVFVE